MTDLLITNIAELATPTGTAYRKGADQARIERRQDVEILCRPDSRGVGRLAFVGSAAERQERFGDLPDAERLDAAGRTVVPGFVDAHTHLPWAGTRESEFAQRLEGKTYLEIATAGGGILSTVRSTREASEDELTANTLSRLNVMLEHGTTTSEVKSGYGLTKDDELKQLRAIRRAGEEHVVDVVPTLLAAHDFPPERRGSDAERARWVEEIAEEIVPAVAEEGLARFCDVFCEEGYFDVEQSRRVLEAGRRHGMIPRLHADEFVDSGAAELAAELGAASADHLVAVSHAGIEAMAEAGVAEAGVAEAGVAGVMLPGVSFFLMKDDFAPARRLVEAGVPVVLASDYNPGSSHTASLPFIVQLGVFKMKLAIEECLTAITLNPAVLLGLGDEIGTVEEGKRADLVILDGPNLLHLGYRLGTNPVWGVVKDGRVV